MQEEMLQLYLMIAPARENSTAPKCKPGPIMTWIQAAYFWKRRKSARCTAVGESMATRTVRGTHKLLEILSILTTQATVCFPHPIPPRRMSAPRSEENHGVVGFNWNILMSMQHSDEGMYLPYRLRYSRIRLVACHFKTNARGL